MSRFRATALATDRSEWSSGLSQALDESLFAPPGSEARGSAVRMRVSVPLATIPAEALVSDEVRLLEDQLVNALRRGENARALMLASSLVYSNPEHVVARRIKSRCAQNMTADAIPFPSDDAIPVQCLDTSELAERNLSRRAAHMLSCIDGALTVEEVIDISALPQLVAYDVLDALVREGIIDVI
jgi:hypothetical protein